MLVRMTTSIGAGIAVMISLEKLTFCHVYVAFTLEGNALRRPFRRRRQHAGIGVVSTREQVPVGIHRHCDGAMPEAFLHHLRRQAEATILWTIDRPGGIEMAQGVHPAILAGHNNVALVVGLVGRYGYTGDHLRRQETPLDDVRAAFDVPATVRENIVQFLQGIAFDASATG